MIVLGKHGQVVEEGRFVQLFSNPNSELTKLLDESTNKQEQDGIDEDEVEKIEQADREAEEIEKLQQEYGQLQQLKELIDSLPEELRDQLIQELTLDAAKKVQHLDSALDEDLKR